MMERWIWIGILAAIGGILLRMMFRPPEASHHDLFSAEFDEERLASYSGEMGKSLLSIEGKRKYILPTEFDSWTKVTLFEYGLIFYRNRKEEKVFFHEVEELSPVLMNSLFVKWSYLAYRFRCKDGRSIMLKSNEMPDLDLLLERLITLSLVKPGKAEFSNRL